MRKHLAGLFLMLAAISAPVASPDHWIEIHSPHFIVLTNSNEATARHIAAQFERVRLLLRSFVPATQVGVETPVMVIALKDKASMESLESAAVKTKGSIEVGGMFLPDLDRSYAVIRIDGNDPQFTMVRNQYTHYMLRYESTRLPPWLDLGIAEFYQSAEIADHYAQLGNPQAGYLFALRQQPLMPLATFLAIDKRSPDLLDKIKRPFFDSESWALTHYLIMGDLEKGTHRFQDYMQLVLAQTDPVEAAHRAFGDFGPLQDSLTRYVHFQDLKAFRVTGNFAVDESAFKARPVTAGEADAERAEILMRNRQISEAETLVTAVLASDPANARACEVMGDLRMANKDFSGAEKWYAQAAEHDPESYIALQDYAASIMQGGDKEHDQTIETSLRNAIKLNPQYAPSYDSLATFYASRHEKLDEAHQLNIQAITLQPDILAFRLNAADVLAQAGDYTSAFNALNLALQLSYTAQQTDIVRAHIAAVTKLQNEHDHPQ